MSYRSSILRVLTVGVLLVLTFGASGCTPSDAPVATAESSGWAVLSSASDAVSLRLDLYGAAYMAGDVLTSDGVTGWGETDAPVGFDPTKSFTVAAWASLFTRQPFANILSQVGEVAASFYLGLADGLPAFSMKDSDTNEEGHTTRAAATDELPIGDWVHLAGVFDAERGMISLYVNGVLSAKTAFDAPRLPAGPLTVGRSQARGVPSDQWPGAITEVRVTPDAASIGDIEKLMEDTRPADPPPSLTGPDPSTYANGALNGTWESVLSPADIEPPWRPSHRPSARLWGTSPHSASASRVRSGGRVSPPARMCGW